LRGWSHDAIFRRPSANHQIQFRSIPQRPSVRADGAGGCRAGITGGTLHGFRRGHATELLRAGVAPRVTQARTGTFHCGDDEPSIDRDATDKIESVFAIDPAEKKQAK
jgi:hypothetical protein